MFARNTSFRSASIQGDVGREILSRHDKDAGRLETMYVVTGYLSGNERCLERSAAVLYCLGRLDGMIWRVASRTLGLLPVSALNALYDRVASYRKRLPVKCDIRSSARSLERQAPGRQSGATG